ncbi:MAG: YihY/virulence factor BrkB family protein [Gammaproteobacteria bacterium]|nr:YihY/virulence factor BrkB family protein [Gammaproteobacteria bacterium]
MKSAAARRSTEFLVKRPGSFLWRTVKSFQRNQGLLLSGAVAYYGLLSIVPLLALLLVGLSHFIPEEALLASVRTHLDFIIPISAEAMTNQIAAFLQYRKVIGWVGFGILIFFATMAFTVLENAMSVIFFHRVNIHRRHFMVSAMIPFIFIALLGLGVVVVTLVSGALQGLDREQVSLFGYTWILDGASGLLLYLLGVVGLIFLMTSLYFVMPVGQIAFRHALIGGLTATVLWEIVRHVLVWYFTSLSLVNMVYGSLATAIVVLLSFEFAALILLFGAQVIAEFERCVSEETTGFTT